MDASDASLRPVLVAGVAPLEPRVVLFALDARVLADVVFSTAASVAFRAACFFAVETALLFTVDLTGLATDFVAAARLFEAGLSALLIPVACLSALGFVSGGLPVFEALLLFAIAAVFAADLVAVAFMVSSLNELRPVQLFPCTAMPVLADGPACIALHLVKSLLPLSKPESGASLYQTLFQAANKCFLRQVFADEDHFAASRLVLRPFCTDVAAHHLMYALKYYFPVGTVHP